MPGISQQGTSPVFGTGINDFDYKLLIYHGLRQTAQGDTRPLASHSAYDHVGSKIGDLELKWAGALGIYENFIGSKCIAGIYSDVANRN